MKEYLDHVFSSTKNYKIHTVIFIKEVKSINMVPVIFYPLGYICEAIYNYEFDSYWVNGFLYSKEEVISLAEFREQRINKILDEINLY